MEVISVSAPGKVIIHGEHAVVFGKRALAGSLGLRTKLTLQPTNDNTIVVNLPDIGTRLQWDCDEINTAFSLPLCDVLSPAEVSADTLAVLKKFAGLDTSVTDTRQLATIAFLYLFCSISPSNGLVPSLYIDISSTLPTSAGLGSSAAFSTCLATGLLISSKVIAGGSMKNGCNESSLLTAEDLDLINRWSFMSEKIIHGRPSGIDNAVSTYGGALRFQAGKIEPLERMPEFQIVLINTRVPRSTKQLVESVRLRHDQFPDIIQPVLDSIEAITRQCESTLSAMSCAENRQEMFATLEQLIDINRHHLEALGVGHPSLDFVCSIATRHGLHAKLTGAGGGGCAFALIPSHVSSDTVKKAIADWTEAGFDCFITSLGGPGVTAVVSPSLSVGNDVISEVTAQSVES